VPRVYFYKLIADNGGAPCVQDDLLSLAICKPMIRSMAERDDLIFGFAAKSLHTDNRLLYIARVTAKVRNGDYYTTGRFAHRGDCIYERRGDRFVWRSSALHHGSRDLVHDLGEHPDYPKANVLLSDDFRYLGENGSAEYKARYPLVKDAVENLGRGHRVHHDERLWIQLQALMREVWKGTRSRVAGEPTSDVRHGVCHRGRWCGVLGDQERLKQ
jgi:hypothetical protein